MRFDVLTLFPELVDQVRQWGITERAHRQKLFELHCWNPRDFTTDVHHTVDGRPFGGGPGMVMMYQPLADALQEAVRQHKARALVVYLSPQGSPLTQAAVNRFATLDRLILVAGRYEGIDERFVESHVDEEWSVGDYVVSGGELPAMMLMDAVVRQLPGALGHADSAQQDSFMQGLLDYPHYTRPEKIGGTSVPKVLLGGHHARIAAWRRKQALLRTLQRRPELLESAGLDENDRQLLSELSETELRDIGNDDEHH
ncbi:MAG TPA: tRNA (guanosine(37)-N1)-methyltransferase TrmD [Gammaproteobacteria bacterium]|nr:tRNA (guanosine(37)-N1)-methyltransferase TrmD [Gammaproteobacteria bacterium]